MAQNMSQPWLPQLCWPLWHWGPVYIAGPLLPTHTSTCLLSSAQWSLLSMRHSSIRHPDDVCTKSRTSLPGAAPTSHPLALCCQIPLFVFYWFLPHCLIPTLCDLLHLCCHPTHFILRNFALDLQPTQTQIRQFYTYWFFPVSKMFRDGCFCRILLVACLFSTQVFFYWAHQKLPPYSTSRAWQHQYY